MASFAPLTKKPKAAAPPVVKQAVAKPRAGSGTRRQIAADSSRTLVAEVQVPAPELIRQFTRRRGMAIPNGCSSRPWS
jgi:hypothetical protein